MSLLSHLQAGVSLSSLTAFLLSVFILNSKYIGGQAVIPEVLHHDSCSQVYLSGPREVLTSPGYPLSYRNNTSCQWHILAEQDEIITLSFDDIDIEDDIERCDQPPCCTFNWVKIGPGNEDRFCGQSSSPRTQMPTTIAKSGHLWIKFHTGYRTEGGRGFRLTFVVGKKHMKSCASDEFQCVEHGNCILSAWRCNKRYECLDESDEKDCPKLCTRTQLPCESGPQCYDPSQRCDGYMDCADYSDELDCGRCGTNMTACGSSLHACYNPYLSRCNRILDCPNGEDEQDCSLNCHSRKIQCSSGSGCYSIEERCNGIAQCSDASDEKNCRSDICRSERGGFLCRNRHCIRETWRCDRTNDCGDESDEINCLRNSVIAAAVIGSLICGLLLIIAISCSCKLYALRHSDTHSSGMGGIGVAGSVASGGSSGHSGSGETPMSRLEREFVYREPPPAYAIAVGGMNVGPQWGDCPPARVESRPRRSRRRALRHDQHRRSCQSGSLPSCSSPTTGESSVASTSSSASSPSVPSVMGENPSGLTSPSQSAMEPSTSQSRKKSSALSKQPEQADQDESELKLEMSGELLNEVEMVSTSDVVPLLP